MAGGLLASAGLMLAVRGADVTAPVYARAEVLVAVAGALLSLLFGLLVHVLAAARRRAEEAVAAATAQARSAAARAEEQAALLHSVLHSISDGVGVVDAEGRPVLRNPAAADMLGTAGTEDASPEWPARFGVFRQDGVTPFPAGELPPAPALAGLAQDNVPMVIRNVRHPEGLVVTVSTRPLDSSAGHRGAVAIYHDITERTRADFELAEATTRLQLELAQRRAAEAELRAARDELARQKAYLAQVLDALEIAVLTCDVDGRIVHANRTSRGDLPGRPRTVAETVTHLNLTRADGSVPAPGDTPLDRALAGRATDAELVVGPPERRRVVRAHGRPLVGEAGQVTGAVVSAYDVTALREREADLAAFAGVVAHDLNSPLATIGGYAELLDDELADVLPGAAGAGARDHLARVSATVERMRQLIEDLLAYTSAGDALLRLSDVDLRTVVDDVVTNRPDGRGADVFVGPLPVVRADAGMIRQLIDNLIGNALKYTPPGQAARIDVTATPAPPGWVRVEVADRGIGIPTGQHDAVFDGFHRAHRGAGYAGTGLGLAICRRIVQRHGGMIGAADHPGGGTVFHVTLRAAGVVGPGPAPERDPGPAEPVPSPVRTEHG